MNLSVETQQEVIFLEDLCKIFLLSFTVSTCLKMHFRHPKIFWGSMPPDPPSYARCRLPAGLPLAAKLAPHKNLVYSPAMSSSVSQVGAVFS